jgi:hypothetical protein
MPLSKNIEDTNATIQLIFNTSEHFKYLLLPLNNINTI